MNKIKIFNINTSNDIVDKIILEDLNLHEKAFVPLTDEQYEYHIGSNPSSDDRQYHDRLNTEMLGYMLIEQGLSDKNFKESLDNVKKIYRFPKLNISRDKVSLWCDNNDAKVTRKPEEADVLFVSKKLFQSFITNVWNANCVRRDQFTKKIRDYKHLFVDYKSVIEWINNNLDEKDLISVDYRHYYYGGDKTEHSKKYGKLLESLRKLNEWDVYAWIETKMESVYNNVIAYNGKLMLDEVATNLMSSESVIFDDEMYLQVKQMIKARNRDDVTVAMTTMANCNMQPSMTYLGLLFFHYTEVFKTTSFWNSVAFKSLRNVCDEYINLSGHWNSAHCTKYENLIKQLVKDDALTINAMQHVLDLVFENCILSPAGLTENDVFQIKRPSLKLTPEFQQKVKETGSLAKAANQYVDLPF